MRFIYGHMVLGRVELAQGNTVLAETSYSNPLKRTDRLS
jgi:hypothetical protein